MSSLNFYSNTLLAAAITLLTWILWGAGEARIDAYIASYTVSYLIIKILLRPKRLYRDPLLIVLLIVFAAIVAYKAYQVLAP